MVCCCSLADGHLGQSRVRDDHRDHKRAAAVHLPHLLRHARHHVRLLWIPDQVSQFPSVELPCYCSKPLCSPQAGYNFKTSSIAVGNNIQVMVTVHLQHPDGYICCLVWLFQLFRFSFLSLHRFLNEAMKVFDATEVVPINFVFFTASAIIAGVFTISLRVMRQIQLSSNPVS